MLPRRTLSSKDTDSRKKSLRAVLKHKTLGSLMKEAVSSPVGSTERKRAQKLLAVMRKGGVMDGKGGPGTGTSSYITPSPATPNERFVFLRGAPPLAPQGMRFDGQGGPGTPFLSSMGLTPPAQTAAPAPTPAPATGAPAILGQLGLKNAPTVTKPGVPSGLSGLFNVSRASTLPPAPQGSYSDYVAGEANKSTALSPGVQGYTNTTTPTPTGTATPVATYPPAQTGSGSSMAGYTGSGVGLPSTGGAPTKTASTGGSTGGAASGPSGFSNLRQAAGAAVAQNQGANMFAYEQAIRSLSPELANMPSESLPYGSALTNQIDKLGATLKKEYKIDELYNRMAALSEGSNTIQGDLEAYIRGKDDYLNDVDKLIQGAEGRLANVDTSNPVVAAQGKQYLDYLYMLKGRQSQRYADFLTTSVDLYKKKFDQATNNYNRALDFYEKDLDRKTQLTMSEFNTYMGALQGMYTEIAEAPKKALEMEYMRTQITAAKAKMAADAIGTYGSGNFLDNHAKIKANFATKDGLLDPAVNNLRGAVDNAMQQKGITASDAVKSLMWIMGDSLAALKSNPDAYNKEAQRYLSLIGDYARNPIPGAEIGTNVDLGVIQTLGSDIQSTMSKNFLDDPDSVSTLQKATKDLVNPRGGVFSLFKTKAPTRQAFVDEYKDRLDPDFLDYLYTDFEDYNKDPNSRQFLGKIFSPAVLKVDANTGEPTGEQESIAKRKNYNELTPQELTDTITSRYIGKLLGGY